MNTQKLALAGLIILSLSACGQLPNPDEQQCTDTSCSEKDVNAPVPGSPSDPNPSNPERDPASAYAFPAFSNSWGMPRAMYDKMVNYYEDNERSLGNPRYVTIIDFNQHSSKKRWYLFDLKTGTLERHVTAHGTNSDPDNDGYPTAFSNVNGSKQSSLGFYLTLGTYTGSNGYSMRLKGLSSTNSNAEARAIVVHPADYVSDSAAHAGRSWGCPALDPKISKSVIDRIKGGSLMLISI
jgi:hypothetical protein